jgi:uncharacterized Zn finger protein (UPF0148 family)
VTEILLHCDKCSSNIWWDVNKLPMIVCPVCHTGIEVIKHEPVSEKSPDVEGLLKEKS